MMSCSERIQRPACSASDLANNEPTLQDALLALVLELEAITVYRDGPAAAAGSLRLRALSVI